MAVVGFKDSSEPSEETVYGALVNIDEKVLVASMKSEIVCVKSIVIN